MKRMMQWMLLGLALLLSHSNVQASELSDRLSTDRYVLLMRHALAPGVGDPPGYSLARCETQRILNDEGQRQAVRIGQWLRTQGVAQAVVYTSAWCRCTQTAELLGFAPALVEPSLASFFDEPHLATAQNKHLQAFIAQALRVKKERALILVTHHVNILEFMGHNIGSGDMVLAHVNAQGRLLDYKLYPSP